MTFIMLHFGASINLLNVTRSQSVEQRSLHAVCRHYHITNTERCMAPYGGAVHMVVYAPPGLQSMLLTFFIAVWPAPLRLFCLSNLIQIKPISLFLWFLVQIDAWLIFSVLIANFW